MAYLRRLIKAYLRRLKGSAIKAYLRRLKGSAIKLRRTFVG